MHNVFSVEQQGFQIAIASMDKLASEEAAAGIDSSIGCFFSASGCFCCGGF